MKYATVCSGIEAPTVAWEPLGWKPVFFSEIEKFPCAVLSHHYPNVPNYGDMTNFKEWPDATIDLICGGTPCQSFSIAGLRKGLDDPRGNLMLTYLAIADRYRPRWLVWENVPGVLSSNKGRDFGTFLGALGELGYGFAYRILNAQFFGVPQRRYRVFVVGYLGDWRRAAAVLFERHSLQGHPAPSRKAGQEIAGTVSARTSGGGGFGTDFECSGGLVTNALNAKGGSGRMDGESETFVIHTLRGEDVDASEAGTGRGTPIVPVPILEVGARTGKSTDDLRAVLGIGSPGDPMYTLQAGKQHAIAFDCKASGQNGFGIGENAPTLRAMNGERANCGGQIAVSLNIRGREDGSTAELSGEIATALRASQGGSDKAHAMIGNVVRRLTPTECERLQGFQDNYTKIPYRNKPADKCPDGPRYKAIGNSMAVPVVRWIGERIQMADGF